MAVRPTPRRLGAAGLVAAVALAAGCGGGGGGQSTAARDAPAGTADYFVGKADGIGASVDFGAADRVTGALRPALTAAGRRPLAVGVAAILNGRSRVEPAPTFVGVLVGGATVPLTSAWLALAGRDDPAARRARALLPVPAPLAPEATAAVYLTLPRAEARRLTGVRMHTASGDAVDLSPQER